MKYLITGASSGLGKHFFEVFGGIPFTRQTSIKQFEDLRRKGVDIIIHAAFNSTRSVNTKNLNSYIKDNVLLTEQLLYIPHKKFIHISTVDVYPKDGRKHSENEIIDLDLTSGTYPVTKLMSESLVKETSANYLILRCATLLGKYSRINSLIKIIQDKKSTLTLSPDSTFNYILHSYVSDFLKLAIKRALKGIFNLASSKNITLKEAADVLEKNVRFGNYLYNVGDIDNRKAAVIDPDFKKTSREVIIKFLKSL